MRYFCATLRRRPAPLVGTFMALVAAAMVVIWALSVGLAGSASSVPAARLTATAVVVTGNQQVAVTSGHGNGKETDRLPLTSYRRVPADLAATLAATDGVAVAVADRSVPVALLLPSGQTVTGTGGTAVAGYGWQSAALTPFTLTAGQAPAGAHQIVVGAGLARTAGVRLGEAVRLAGQPLEPFTVSGIAAAPRGDPAGGQTVFFSDTEAAVLYGHPGQADLIGIVARPGVAPDVLASRVRAAVAGRGLTVLGGQDRGKAEDPSAASDLANLSALATGGGIDLVLVSLFVVASTVALAVAERARTMAVLRAVGATGGQVRRMVRTELGALGVAAGLLAYLPGTWLAGASLRGLAAHGFVAAATRAWTSPLELLASVGAGVLVAQLAGWLAARRASRVHPATALAEATVERRSPRPLRLLAGLGALGGGVTLSVVAVRQADPSQQLNEALLSLLTLMVAIALLGPYLITLAEAVCRCPLRLAGGTPGRLASAGIRSRPRRMAAAAVAIALPVAFAGAITVVDSTQTHADVTESHQRLAANAVVSAPGPGLAPAALADIDTRPGVRGSVGLTPTTVYLPYQGAENTAAEAVTPGPIGAVLRLGVTSGSFAHFGPGDVALSTLAAGKGGLNVHVGEEITTYLADGTPYRATVSAVYRRSLGFADAIVPAGAAGGGHLGAGTVAQVLVAARPGVTSAALARQLDTLGERYPGLHIASRDVANAQATKQDAQDSYANDLLLWFLAGLGGLALVDILVVATFEGRDELALLQRVGASSRQLLAMTGLQVAEVTVVGATLGTAAAAAAVVAVAKALTGSAVPYVGWQTPAVILGLATALAAAAVLAPTVALLARKGDG